MTAAILRFGARYSATTGRAGGMRKAPKSGHGVDAFSCLTSSCPVGTSENSPAIHRGVKRWRMISSPVGTIERRPAQPSLRDEEHGDDKQMLHAHDTRSFETRTERQSLFDSHRHRRWINVDSALRSRHSGFVITFAPAHARWPRSRRGPATPHGSGSMSR